MRRVIGNAFRRAPSDGADRIHSAKTGRRQLEAWGLRAGAEGRGEKSRPITFSRPEGRAELPR